MSAHQHEANPCSTEKSPAKGMSEEDILIELNDSDKYLGKIFLRARSTCQGAVVENWQC